MKITIAFYEEIQANGERNTFQNLIKEMKIPLFHNWNDLSSAVPTILFFHGGNEADLNNRTDFGSSLKTELSNTWLIEFGGYDTEKKNRNGKIVSYIKYSDLQTRLSEIIEGINKLSEITKERLEEIIFAIDPKLEELLKPFATLIPTASKLPVAKDSEGNEIKKGNKTLNIKEALADYVKDKIAKQ